MTETIQIKGMNCGGCVNSVKLALGRLPLTRFDVEVGQAKVDYEPAKVDRRQIVTAIEAAGFSTADENAPR